MMCTWLSDSEFERYSQCEDKDVNEVLQQVRSVNPVWFVDQREYVTKSWFRKPLIEVRFTLYEIYEYPTGNWSKPEVREQVSVYDKRSLLNFLYGLNVGYHFKTKPYESN